LLGGPVESVIQLVVGEPADAEIAPDKGCSDAGIIQSQGHLFGQRTDRMVRTGLGVVFGHSEQLQRGFRMLQ
jgi:hypothetical protein